MKFLLIDKRKRVGELDSQHYAVQRIQQVLEGKGIAHEFCHFDEILMTTEAEKPQLYAKNQPLTEYSHIIMRGHRPNEYQIKQLIVSFASQNNIKVLNSEFIKIMPDYNKIVQMELMTQNGIAYLDSCYRLDGQYHLDKTAIKKIGFPLIYKHIYGEYRLEKIDGEFKTKKNIFLIKDINSLKQQCTERKDPQKYFIQKFVDIGEDVRMILIKGKFLSGWKRKATRNFLTVSKGEYSLLENPEKELLKLAEDTASLFRADYCAIDIIYSDNKPYVLEINMDPGFKAFETKIEGSNVDVAEEIVESVL